MAEQLPLIIDESIKLELNLSHFYGMFSSFFPEDSDFWNKLVNEERHHASLIKTGRDLLLTCDEFPAEVLSPSLNQLIEVNKRITSLKNEYNKKIPLKTSAFEVALSLEESAGEIHFNEAMNKPSRNEYVKIYQKLNHHDKDHYKRIFEYMRSLGS